MSQPIKVVHFLNQFFAGVGGEEQANLPVEVREGAVGPGRALQAALGDSGQVIATIVSGDNYFTEESAASARAVTDALSKFQPDVVVAGPAFNAGRYGLACGEVCVLANALGIPAATAMYPENPGVLEYDTRAYIVPTDESPVRMQEIVAQLARLATKLGSGEGLGPAEEEGYLPRGIRQPGLRADSAAKRSVDMLLARMGGREWTTELPIRMPDAVVPAQPIADLSNARLGLVTTGGLVPRGNPDGLVRGGSTEYLRYSIDGIDSLSAEEWESVHRGFYTAIVNENPNYVMPLNVVRDMEQAGEVASVYPWILTTSGVGTAIAEARKIGAEMAEELKSNEVDGALLVAT